MKSPGFRKPRIIEAASIFATVIGTFKVIGTLSGIWIFTYIAQTFALSPAPSPYSKISASSSRDPDSGFSFGCEDQSGSITWAKWDYFVRSAVPGPHRRVVTFLSYFQQIHRPAPTEEDTRRLTVLTRYYFCSDGVLTRAAGCSVTPVAITFKNNPKGEEPPFLMRVPCLH